MSLSVLTPRPCWGGHSDTCWGGHSDLLKHRGPCLCFQTSLPVSSRAQTALRTSVRHHVPCMGQGWGSFLPLSVDFVSALRLFILSSQACTEQNTLLPWVWGHVALGGSLALRVLFWLPLLVRQFCNSMENFLSLLAPVAIESCHGHPKKGIC